MSRLKAAYREKAKVWVAHEGTENLRFTKSPSEEPQVFLRLKVQHPDLASPEKEEEAQQNFAKLSTEYDEVSFKALGCPTNPC